jgi:hypothetical protein
MQAELTAFTEKAYRKTRGRQMAESLFSSLPMFFGINPVCSEKGG